MSAETNAAVLEGRVIAQRRVIAALVALLLDDRPATRARLRRLVSRDALDGVLSEDPGAVPDAAFGILGAEDAELRAIADRVAAIRAADQ